MNSAHSLLRPSQHTQQPCQVSPAPSPTGLHRQQTENQIHGMGSCSVARWLSVWKCWASQFEEGVRADDSFLWACQGAQDSGSYIYSRGILSVCCSVRKRNNWLFLMAAKALDCSNHSAGVLFYGSANTSVDPRNGEAEDKNAEPDGSNLS